SRLAPAAETRRAGEESWSITLPQTRLEIPLTVEPPAAPNLPPLPATPALAPGLPPLPAAAEPAPGAPPPPRPAGPPPVAPPPAAARRALCGPALAGRRHCPRPRGRQRGRHLSAAAAEFLAAAGGRGRPGRAGRSVAQAEAGGGRRSAAGRPQGRGRQGRR